MMEATLPAVGLAAVAIFAAANLFGRAIWRRSALPLVPGVEGAGIVTALGSAVTDLRPGQRVAWVYGPGSYS